MTEVRTDILGPKIQEALLGIEENARVGLNKRLIDYVSRPMRGKFEEDSVFL